MNDKNKPGRRELKRATATIDGMMEKHCGVKQTPRLSVFFMSPEAYALHVQRKFSRLPEWEKKKMETIGKMIAKHSKRQKIKIDNQREGGIEYARRN